MVWPAAGEVGPALLSSAGSAGRQASAADGSSALCPVLLGCHLSTAKGRALGVTDTSSRRVLRVGAGCPCSQEKFKGEFRALPFGKMVIFAITNPVVQKEKLFSKQKGCISRVVQL